MLDGMGGVFCIDSDIAPLMPEKLQDFSIFESHSGKRSNGVAPYAIDREAATRLWEIIEQMTGVSFPE